MSAQKLPVKLDGLSCVFCFYFYFLVLLVIQVFAFWFVLYPLCCVVVLPSRFVLLPLPQFHVASKFALSITPHGFVLCPPPSPCAFWVYP